jgi:hypothetical protein
MDDTQSKELAELEELVRESQELQRQSEQLAAAAADLQERIRRRLQQHAAEERGHMPQEPPSSGRGEPGGAGS